MGDAARVPIGCHHTARAPAAPQQRPDPRSAGPVLLMATGTLRYFAAVRAAAGVETEPYRGAATLAEALEQARAGHDDRFTTVLARCSFLVDEQPVGGRPHDTVLLGEGAVIDCLPPFAGGAADSGRPTSDPVLRPSPLRTGLAGLVTFGGLAALSLTGRPVLAGALLLTQVLVVLAWLALLDTPGGGGAFVIAVGAALLSDGALLSTVEDSVSSLPAVVALGLLAGLVHQMARRRRHDVTASLAAGTTAVVLVVAVCTLLALWDEPGGQSAVFVSLVAGAAGVFVARLVDALRLGRVLAEGATRRWPGLVAGLAAGTVAAVVTAASEHEQVFLSAEAACLGLAVVAAALAADLAVDLGAAELRPGPRDARRVSALLPAAALLPLAALAPVAYVAGRTLLA